MDTHSNRESLRRIGILHAVLSTAFSSVAIIFQALATKEIPALLLATLSNILGGLIILVALVKLNRKVKISDLRDNFRDLFFLSFLRAFLGSLLFWKGLSLTLGIKAMFFTKAEPYFILAWDRILDNRKIPKKHLGILFLHILGAILLSVGSLERLGETQAGDFILLLAVAILGLSYRFGAKLSSSLGVFETVSCSQLLGGALLLPIGLFLSGDQVFDGHDKAWTYFLFSILLWNVFGFSFWLLALKEVETWIVSSLRAIGPMIAAPIAYFCFDERLSLSQIMGGIIVLLTSFLIVKDRR